MNSSKTYDKPYQYEEEKYSYVDDTVKKTVNLKSCEELRIELDPYNGITVALKEGFAEIFGAELPAESPVYFPPKSKFAVFTWHTATLEITGTMDTDYISTESGMETYIDTHANINEDRDTAKFHRAVGPKVLVCGSPNSGKSTLCKILTNYALKMGYNPIYVDLDIETNLIVPPGCIGASKVKLPLPNDDLTHESICLYHGDCSKVFIKELYKMQVERLSDIYKERIKNKFEELNREYTDFSKKKKVIEEIKSKIDPYTTSEVPNELASGCIINTMIYQDEKPLDLMKFIVEKFDVDYILVLEYEKLFRLLKEVYKNNQKIKIVKIQGSSGATGSEHAREKEARTSLSFKNYFAGILHNLDSFEFHLDLDDYCLFKIDSLIIPNTALETGAMHDVIKVIVTQVNPKELPMENRVIGVLDPQDVDRLERVRKDIVSGVKENKEEFYNMIITSPCRSLIHAISYDPEKNKLIIKSSTSEGIYSKYLMISELKYESD